MTDSTGDPITSSDGHWYKIVLADGRELGYGEWLRGDENNATTLKMVPAGGGMVFRYQRHDGDDRVGQGWPVGDKGYLRGLSVNANGTETTMNLSFNQEHWTMLCGYSHNGSFGFVASQLGNHRVALYGYNENKVIYE